MKCRTFTIGIVDEGGNGGCVVHLTIGIVAEQGGGE